MLYTLGEDNKIILHGEIRIKQPYVKDELFKINLPFTETEYESGNGEGVWAITDNASLEIINDIKSINDFVLVRILNDSIYYNDLKFGDYIIVETRGEKRPVANYEILNSNYNKESEEEVHNIKLSIIRRQNNNI